MNCPYCATQVKIDENGVAQETCTFCGAFIRDQKSGILQLCQNGERYEFKKMQQHIFLEHVDQPVNDLKKYHTFDLYLLLKEVREARGQMYYGLQLLNKASVDDEKFKDSAEEMGEEYEYFTRKAWVIENILLERQGFFPEKITDRVLRYMWEQIKKSKKKPMRISKTKRKPKEQACF